MNGVSMDSTKLLTEKLALSREISILKPELEHLRAQSTYQETVLADKLALQRQVKTLEVELETAKRALETRVTQRNDNSERDAKAQEELAEIQNALSKEKREKERLQRMMEKDSNEWELRRTALETKLDQMRTKLRSTKDKLKETQTELVEAQSVAADKTTSNTGTVITKNARKRSVVQREVDATIGTPDGVAVRGRRQNAKKGRADQTVLGEKSTFSITPFLNRTINLAPETPKADDGQELEAETETEACLRAGAQEPEDLAAEATVPTMADVGSPSVECDSKRTKAALKKDSVEKKVLGNAGGAKMNAKLPSKKRQQAISTLEKVAEETDENEDSGAAPSKASHESSKPLLKPSKATHVVNELDEPKKKKRKLLGAAKTLFDEEDGEATRRPAKFTARSLGRGGLAGPKGNLRAGLGGDVSVFGEFSPLKKDRRGAQASFLG
jgi:hypothetical protein